MSKSEPLIEIENLRIVKPFYAQRHTSYLSFPLHRQDFQIPNFRPKTVDRGARDKYEVGVEAGASVGGAGDMCCLHFSN